MLLLAALLLAGCQALERLGEEDASEVNYRVQIHLTDDRQEAETVRARAETWLGNLPASERPAGASDQLDAVVTWQQPYYRVRIGAFPSREAAEEWLPTIRSEFSDAFVVRARPDGDSS